MVKHRAVKGRCVKWFSRIVRGLNFRSAESSGILKRGFKVDKLFNQLRKGSGGNFHRSRWSFAGGGISHGSIRSITDSVHFFFGHDSDGGIEKIIIERFGFLSEKAVEGVDGRQESKGLSVEFMDKRA